MPKDKKWARTKRAPSGAQVAHDRCCHACSLKHNELFPYMDLNDLIALKEAGDKKVQQIFSDGVPDDEEPFKPGEVQDLGGMTLECSRSFLLMTAKELRKSAQLTKIPKHLVKNVPTVMIRSESDPSQLQEAYIFKHPQKPFRELTIKTYQQVHKKIAALQASQHVWSEEADMALAHQSGKQLDTMKMRHLVDKDGFPTLEEILAKAHGGGQADAQGKGAHAKQD
eukprot:6492137-Amphidinium_carterae.3